MVGKVKIIALDQWVTVNPQKDGRIVLGTRVHIYKDCKNLKNREVVDIAGSHELAKKFPKCELCSNRLVKKASQASLR